MEIELRQEQDRMEKKDRNDEGNDAYALYVYAMRSPVTKDTYLRRLRIFFNHIQLLSMQEPMEIRCNLFSDKARTNTKWAFSKILEFL